MSFKFVFHSVAKKQSQMAFHANFMVESFWFKNFHEFLINLDSFEDLHTFDSFGVCFLFVGI